MLNPLVFTHAILAEFGLFAFLWILVELLNPTEARINRAKMAALMGVAYLICAWFLGGLYYVEVYGSHIKPLIQASDAKWVHNIVMEVKEHVFLFLPILASLVAALLYKYDQKLLENDDARKSIVLLSGLIFVIVFSLFSPGAIVAAGYRFALGAGVA